MKWALALATLLWCALPAAAQQPFFFPIPVPGSTSGCIGGPYTGPGDIVSSPIGWWGIRAYSQTTAGTKAIRIERDTSGGGNQQDINTIACTGLIDIASATSFAGTLASCSGTISGTTLTTTSCSPAGAAQPAQSISGAGINQPAYIVSGSTCGNSGGGTCTLNASQTVASPETITITSAMTVVTLYDQGGSGRDAPAGHLGAPQLLPNCGSLLNNNPCMLWPGRGSDPTTASFSVPAQPYTISAVSLRPTSGSGILLGFTAGANFEGPGYASGANLAEIFWSSSPTAAASDAAFHNLQYVLNTSSSVIAVDATQDSVNTGTAITIGTAGIELGAAAGTPRFGCIGCYMNEIGIWGAAFTGTQQTNVCHNQFTFWGTATSC